MPRGHFSLSTLLWLTAVAAIFLAGFVHSWRLADLRREQQRMIEHTGYIEVADRSKVYVRELLSPSPETWRVQVHLPDDHELRLGLGADVGDDDYPRRVLYSGPLSQTGQTTFTISVYQAADGRWRLATYRPRSGVSLPLDGDYQWLRERDNRFDAGSGGEPLHGAVREYDVGEPIPLWILRREAGGGDASNSVANDSLIVWLETDLPATFRARQAAGESPPPLPPAP